MQRTIAFVQSGRLYQPVTGNDPIVVGTPTWFEWLEQHAAFTFVDHPSGYFMANKRGAAPSEQEWEASRVRAGQNYRVQLGPTPSLTLERLRAAARALTAQHLQG